MHEQLRKFETSIVAAARQSSDAQPPELALDSKWTFSGALIYCITLITTIGKCIFVLIGIAITSRGSLSFILFYLVMASCVY